MQVAIHATGQRRRHGVSSLAGVATIVADIQSGPPLRRNSANVDLLC
jgi:hypothetical protein